MPAIQRLVMPGGLVVFAALLCALGLPLPESYPAHVRLAPPVLFAVALLLSSRFHCRQTIVAIVALAAVDAAMFLYASGDFLPPALTRDLLTGMAFLLPLNFLALCLFPLQGVAAATWLRLGVLGTQPLLLALVAAKWPGAIHGVLDLHWIDLPLAGVVTQSAWLAFAGGFALIPVQHALTRSPVVAALFWSLLAALFALAAEPGSVAGIVYMSAAAVVLVVSQVERSYLLAFRDELTELPSRRALAQALSKLGNHYTIAMVDIDHFKKFNDTFGHDVGDQLLRMVAFKLAGVSGGGTAFRYGGEEFTLLFPGLRLEAALPHIVSVVESIRGNPFAIRRPGAPRKRPRTDEHANGGEARKVKVTVSVGVAQARTPIEVIREADQALYRAKQGGRDRVAAA